MPVERPVTVAIGHMTIDRPDEVVPQDHLGGGVSYSAVTAARLGHDAHIITKGYNDVYVKDLESMGVTVHVLPSKVDRMTIFKNEYDTDGKRQQIVEERQEPITMEDYMSNNFPIDILNKATVIVAPVIGEVDVRLFPKLRGAKLLGLIPQGYFREVGTDGMVSQKRWSGFNPYLDNVDVTVLSEEDIIIANNFDQRLFEQIASESLSTVLTKGKRGASVYLGNILDHEVNAFLLKKSEENDFIGAGDVFAGAFFTELLKENATYKSASTAATFYAALKIMKLSGVGINSIPTEEQYREFKKEQKERIKEFLRKQIGRKKVYRLSLFEPTAVNQK
jgi:sugar/nucleoside kinase (ribokinase family)